MLLISNELGTRAPDPSNNYAAGLVPNWKENTQFFVRLFFSPQQCGADRKINNSWVTVFLGNTPTCAKVNKPQDEQGPNWSLPQGFLRFVVVRQPQAGNFTRKIMVATAKGESPLNPLKLCDVTVYFTKLQICYVCGFHASAADSRSIFTERTWSVCRDNLSRRKQVALWPTELKTPLTFAYLLDGLISNVASIAINGRRFLFLSDRLHMKLARTKQQIVACYVHGTRIQVCSHLQYLNIIRSVQRILFLSFNFSKLYVFR